jgi:hypothetical protein
MTLFPRKLTFQLTPLLDLLLIVIFAQYLDVRDKTAQDRETQSTESAALKSSAARAAEERHAIAAKLAATETELNLARARLDNIGESVRKKLADKDEDARRLAKQRDLLAKALGEIFRLPEQTLRDVMKPLAGKDAARAAEELRKIRRRIEKLRNSAPQQIVRHVVKYEELLKRCDLWEIHVDPRNNVRIAIGPKVHQFRFTAREFQATGNERKDREERRRYVRDLRQDFDRKLFAFYKSLPQTKNVIIVLTSRESETTAAYLVAKAGIQDTADHIARESAGRITLVSTDLGNLEFGKSETRNPNFEGNSK